MAESVSLPPPPRIRLRAKSSGVPASSSLRYGSSFFELVGLTPSALQSLPKLA
jgi:hypothetical protein